MICSVCGATYPASQAKHCWGITRVTRTPRVPPSQLIRLDDEGPPTRATGASVGSPTESLRGVLAAAVSGMAANPRELKRMAAGLKGLVDKKQTGIADATPETSGVTEAHLAAIWQVCQQEDVFLLVRPSTPATARLIELGFPTKSMDVHDKSCDWGLAAGFVPVDQAFNKNLMDANTKRVRPLADLKAHPHGEAQPVRLVLSHERYATLLRQDHFEKSRLRNASDTCPETPGFDHWHCDEKGGRGENAATATCLLRSQTTGEVFWRGRSTSAPHVPLLVWGYNDQPVTGDYDLWMVCPHIGRMNGDRAIVSSANAHGRSAVTPHTLRLMEKLNAACRPGGAPVFNHGAEAQNYSFTQELDKTLLVVCPGGTRPFVARREVLPAILHDIGAGGYVAMRNPKWLRGMTLAVEDMAYAGGDSAIVATGKSVVAPLLESVAVALQRRYRANAKKGGRSDLKPLAAFRNRIALMWPMRLLQAGLMGSGSEMIFLRSACFKLASYERRVQHIEAAAVFARAQEQEFRRLGFVCDDGSLAPEDASQLSQAICDEIPEEIDVTQGDVEDPPRRPTWHDQGDIPDESEPFVDEDLAPGVPIRVGAKGHAGGAVCAGGASAGPFTANGMVPYQDVIEEELDASPSVGSPAPQKARGLPRSS